MPILLIHILIVLVVVGLILWAIEQFPLDPTIARIIRVIAIVLCVLYVLSALLGSVDGLSSFRWR